MISRSVHHGSPSIRDLARWHAVYESALAPNGSMGRTWVQDLDGHGIERIVHGPDGNALQCRAPRDERDASG